MKIVFKSLRIATFVLLLLCSAPMLDAQQIYKVERGDSYLLFFDKNISQYIPHITNMYQRGKVLHNQIWNSDTTQFQYHPQKPVMYLTEWNDDGNAGVCTIPSTTIQMAISPLNFSYFIAPSVERFNHLFNHEYTHVVMSDKYTKRDLRWRKFIGAKVAVNSNYPISAIWSYYTTPRWYVPRWYHEGIACFMETWLGGGVGRALGGYDEMYFRSIVDSKEKLFSVVGLETEGTTQDFQVGTNSYLYGTRFVNYLALKYGTDSLFRFYNRTPDSKRLYTSQFKKVFGKSLEDVWNEWRVYEKSHQAQNIASIKEYPLTEVTPIYDKALGSVSNPLFDKRSGLIYVAVNYPGDVAHIATIDISNGKIRKMAPIDGPMLYQTAYLALDTLNNRIFVTSHNSDIRGLKVYNINNGRLLVKKELVRMSNIVYDNTKDRLYGIFVNKGVSHIAYYDRDLTSMTILYSIPFGNSISDLALSNNGDKLSITLFGNNGEQTLALFNVADLENALFKYESIATMEDTNLSSFKFSSDDTKLIGTSYYTGVSNIWSLDIESKEMKLLSNTDIGLFAPLQIADDTLLALQFEREGMKLVKTHIQEVEDANSIDLLGQIAYYRNPSLSSLPHLKDSSILNVPYEDAYNSIKPYNSFKELAFSGAYPDISGFTDTSSFNLVTPVAGYRFAFQDKLGIHRLNFFIGVSPWSNNNWQEKIHFNFDWHYWGWILDGYYNNSSFYDLFGPLRSSRKGYKVGLTYKRLNKMYKPLEWSWEVGISTYGMMDKLPMFQDIDIDSDITSLQTAKARYEISKLRTSLGGVMPEQGYKLSLDGYTYFAKGKFYPSLSLSYDRGFLIPFVRNTSFFIRSGIGYSFGDQDSAFGNEYFGGFRNNYIDNKDVYRYREINAMPGAKIDMIKAHNFAKFIGELNLKPIRFKNFGLPGLYPTYAQLSLFATDLVVNPLVNKGLVFENFINFGAQLNIEVVLFNYMKTTWSVGYARLYDTARFGKESTSGEWMISLKLL